MRIKLQRPKAPIAVLCTALLLTGCVTNGYRKSKEDTPPQKAYNCPFPPGRLEAVLVTVITYNGPGSWKRDAFWDEYVVALRNPRNRPVTLSSITLTDYAGTERTPHDNPWSLEKESKSLEERYQSAGIAFARYTVPGVLIVYGAGTVAFASAGGGLLAGEAGLLGTAALTAVALPVYYGAVLTINHHNRVSMEKEFARRRVALPLTLAPGETRVGSLFFPMTPSPGAIVLSCSDNSGSGVSTLELGFLRGLHLKSPPGVAGPRIFPSDIGSQKAPDAQH